MSSLTDAAPDSSAGDPSAVDAPSAKGPRQTLTLVAVLLAVFVVPTSISGTGVALPSIAADLHAGPGPVQWVANAFNVAFACFTLAWGSIADIIGRVKAFALGAAVYTVASIGSVFAANIYLLDIARALAGLGGAAIFACGSAILSTVFSGPARAKAFALFGTVAGIGISAGPSIAGVLVQHAGWRWVFVLHAVALAVVLAIVPVIARHTEETRREGARIDVLGSFVFIVAMFLLTCGIVQGSQWGWGSLGVLGLFAGSIAALVVFAVVERRREHPMLDLALLANRPFLALCLVPIAGSFGFVTMLTYLPSYLTAAGGYGTGAAGLIMVLLTVPMLVCPLLAARLVSRGVSAMRIIYVSIVCLVVGDLGLLLFGPDVSIAVVALPMLITGSGMALAAGLVDGQALEMVAPEQAGMAAGFLNTLRLGSEAIAVAVYASLLATAVSSRIGDGVGAFRYQGDSGDLAGNVAVGDIGGQVTQVPEADRASFSDFLVGAYDSAFHQVLWVLAAVCVVLLVVIATLLRRSKSREA
ncbi:MFS transporter [Streptomyces griseus]|uniref:MFS transporter n=1 Tax=Streptomyces griseus TaxID=1911 RepID=UPI003407D040